MTSPNRSPDNSILDKKQADQMGRFFNSAFNSALLYGGDHPTTVENVLPLYQHCAQWLETASLLTLSIERDSVYIENWCVDKVVNVRRIAGYFKKAGMESVTFEKGLPMSEMKAFIRILGEVHEAPSVKAIEAKLASENAGHIRINYVSYRKVTADEAVIDKQNITTPSPPPMQPPAAATSMENKKVGVGEVLRQLEPVMGASEFLNASNASLENPDDGPGRNTNQNVAALAGQLKHLSAQIQAGDVSDIFATPQEMMDAVVKLRKDVTRNLDLLKATGKLSETGSVMNEELDILGRETIIRLIRDEYKQGAISIKRLAQVIRRLLPDVGELKKIIPFVKDCLLGDGMSLADYLQLVNSLVRELEDEGLSQSLSGAAEEMGVSMDEIMQSIKSDPADTARLIILASEIRKGTNADTDQLSSILADYVEKVSRSLSHDTKDKTNSQSVLHGFESRLLEKFKAQGMGDAVVDQVRRRLSNAKRSFELPKGVFDIKVTAFFLDHEIKRYVRYNSPFSALVLSIISIGCADGKSPAATPEETNIMMTLILTTLKKMLRDLDLVGNMLWISDNFPFIILPMTDQKGAKSVKLRVANGLNKLKAPMSGVEKTPHVVVTAVAFDGKKTNDTASFFKYLMERHQEEIEQERKAKNAAGSAIDLKNGGDRI